MDDRVPIILDPVNPHLAGDEVIAALAALPVPVIFQRGGMLVIVAEVAAATPRQRFNGQTSRSICVVTTPLMRELMASVAIFRAPRKRKDKDGNWIDELVTVSAPKPLAEAILARGQWKDIPPLTGLVYAPTLRPDLTVLEQAGYDWQTGLMADFAPMFAPIPYRPDRATALAALDELLDLLSEFPFSSDVDRSVALALILSALVRTAGCRSPAFGVSAIMPGSGKTQLAQVAAILALGREAAATAPPRNGEEEKKLLFAAAMVGVLFLLIDNVEHRVIESDALCSLLTAETISDRVLAVSKTAEAAAGFMIVFTGNGLTLGGDISARTLVCNLAPKTDRPEHRRFARDLSAWLPDARYRLVSRALTFLRGYIVSGEVPDVPPWTRFPQWDALVRRAIIWGGLPDPLLALRANEKADPRRAELEAVVHFWHAEFGGTDTSVRAAVNRAHALAVAGNHGFKDALIDVAGERGEVNPKRLGHWMKRLAGRPAAGRIIAAGEPYGGAATWRIETAEVA